MSTSNNNAASITPPPRQPRPPKPPKPHPSITALATFLSTCPQTNTPPPPPLPSKLRYDIYGTLLLLPPTSPLTTPPWSTYISSLPPSSRSNLYKSLATSLNVTHIAINAPIPAKSTDNGNLIRAPQITPLHGTFSRNSSSNSNNANPSTPTDFNNVFWTSTSQHGIFQTWCPLYTMFSRGNITEKARIYEVVHHQLQDFNRNNNGGSKEVKTAAVDLFVGIGYFAFSYLKAGVDVVYGWDINPWSIEGCRRGAVGNKWGVKVITTNNHNGRNDDDEDEEERRLLIFEESNEYAPTRLQKIKAGIKEKGREWVHIMHVNLGLLPTSRGAYKTALEVLCLNDGWEDSWVHVHENVAREDVESMKYDIVKRFEELAGEVWKGGKVGVECEHVEFVKSWAPGVWHCVFDVKVIRR